jgi:SAM-dependent methyltransferase
VSRSLRTPDLAVRSEALAPSDDQFDVLARWVADIASPGASLLEIGAGDGDDEYFALIRPLVKRIVGVDPDPQVAAHAGLDEWHQKGIESFASGSGAAGAVFDVALAVYVVEHVAEPVAFFTAARACLRPGASLFVVTPNLWHYFGAAAKASVALGVEDKLLGAVRARRAERGHNHVAHFPVVYRANSVRALRRVGAEAGFSTLEIRHLENPAIFETYFPDRLFAFPRWYSRSLHRIGRPELFGTLICRFVN